jgi:hypothetical protein
VIDGQLLKAVLGDNITIKGCTAYGTSATSTLLLMPSYFAAFYGTTNVDFLTNKIYNYYNGPYFFKDSGIIPTNIRVNGNHFEHTSDTLIAVTQHYPAGCYFVYVRNGHFEGNTCVNILPNPLDATPDRMGYGFYEGDGVVGEVQRITVANNVFSHTRTGNTFFIGILSSYASDITLIGNVISQVGQAYVGIRANDGSADTSMNINIVGNVLVGCQIEAGAGAPAQSLTGSITNILDNKVYNCPDYGIKTLGASPIKVNNNQVWRCGRGGIIINSALTADVSHNMVIDCNTLGSTVANNRAGIFFSGCYWGSAIGNIIENKSADGKMYFGIDFGSAVLGKWVYHSNQIAKMRVDGTVTGNNYANGYTAEPTKGFWYRGEMAYHMQPSYKGITGWMVVNHVDTRVRVTAAAGATTIEVESTVGMTAGYYIGIVLDNGEVHWSGIASITDADTLVINDAIPVGRSALGRQSAVAYTGGVVHHYEVRSFPYGAISYTQVFEAQVTAQGLMVVAGGLDISGGTSAEGRLTSSAANGLLLRGRLGSSYDIYCLNAAGGDVWRIPTGTPNLEAMGNVKLAGSVLKYFEFFSGGRMYSNTGTPEGSVAAPVGSMFLRTDGGAGTTLYIKESGVGNTGWIAK